MSDRADDSATGGSTLSPLPGESGIPSVAERTRTATSTKGLLAVGLLVVSLVAASAFWIQRFTDTGKKDEEADSRRVADRPTAASTQPRKLEMPQAPGPGTPGVTPPRIPAIEPTPEEAEPIGVRRTGQGAPTGGGPRPALPEDAPVLLVSTRPGSGAAAPGAPAKRPSLTVPDADAGEETDPDDPIAITTRNLQAYQRQLQGLLDSLTTSSAMATGQPDDHPPTGALLGGSPGGGPSPGGASTGAAQAPAGSLFGGQLQGSATSRATATTVGNRSLTLPKGTAFTCALKTKVISATSGLVGCQVQRNVFSDDGRVLLIERGSHMDGEYRSASFRPGTVRIPVLWTRIRTPHGVTVDIDSPGTGQLGESGIDGHVDNRWGERIGAALLLSLIDDSVRLVMQSQASESQADTVVLQSTTDNTSKLAEKVLDSTINIPPLIYQNQGGIVGIYVARDVDFSSVYELKPTVIEPPRQ